MIPQAAQFGASGSGRLQLGPRYSGQTVSAMLAQPSKFEWTKPHCRGASKGSFSEMAAKRALITGITGMVGSHLAEYLLDKTDWEIVGMCRWRSPLDNLSSVIGRINAQDRISLLYGDLRDTLSIQAAVGSARP